MALQGEGRKGKGERLGRRTGTGALGEAPKNPVDLALRFW